MVCHALILCRKDCIRAVQAVRILRHHYVTSVAILTALICTNPLTKEG
ncbi:antitoxin PHD [Siccibacter turicensis]|uniref:Antitoxin PHD n=1 Tax=Siccibacter turicensis TaxID=357233 RepID=A0A2P8VH25_9ENTR|nr:antitoxin PHD [Siccibacter turicensis]